MSFDPFLCMLTLTPDPSGRIREDMCGLDEITRPPEPMEVRLESRFDTSTPEGGVDILQGKDNSLNTILLAGMTYFPIPLPGCLPPTLS